jgi:hypothetical protein
VPRLRGCTHILAALKRNESVSWQSEAWEEICSYSRINLTKRSRTQEFEQKEQLRLESICLIDPPIPIVLDYLPAWGIFVVEVEKGKKKLIGNSNLVFPETISEYLKRLLSRTSSLAQLSLNRPWLEAPKGRMPEVETWPTSIGLTLTGHRKIDTQQTSDIALILPS